ncbi:MAG: hypothetical protein GX076_09610 [Clostridiales bacterium]|nr:hypothetical protein [Clostridiales bacterium]
MDRIIRIVFTVIGFLFCGLAIALYLLSGFGSDPVTLFTAGLSFTLKVRVGIASLIFHFVIILLAFIIDRKFIGIATFASLFIVGPSIDLFMTIFSPIVTAESAIAIRLIFYLIAFFSLSFGIALYLAMNTGISASDMTPVMVSVKAKFQYRWCKVVYDIVLVITGTLLGGVFGWGTIFAALFTGPAVQYLRDRVEKYSQLLD